MTVKFGIKNNCYWQQKLNWKWKHWHWNICIGRSCIGTEKCSIENTLIKNILYYFDTLFYTRKSSASSHTYQSRVCFKPLMYVCSHKVFIKVKLWRFVNVLQLGMQTTCFSVNAIFITCVTCLNRPDSKRKKHHDGELQEQQTGKRCFLLSKFKGS